MSAEWRGCLGGVYAVSDKGGVRRELGGKGARAGRLCRTSKHHSGYVHTNVCCGGRQRRIAVHILMAEAFLGPRPFGKECNHKDGVKGNNVVSNLEYVTHRENMLHAMRLGLRRHAHGVAQGSAKLNDRRVLELRADHASGMSSLRLAKKYGVAKRTIWMIVTRRTWRHVA